MGFFSWNCECCGESLKSPYDPQPVWQNEGVAIFENGYITGEYDGYGAIKELDILAGEPTIYHKKCWEESGRPMEYRGESQGAEDQGYFYGDPEEPNENPEGGEE